MRQLKRRFLLIALSTTCVLAVSCGGEETKIAAGLSALDSPEVTLTEDQDSKPVARSTPAVQPPSDSELRAALFTELARLGKDPDHTTTAAPTDSEHAVFDLHASVDDSQVDEGGPALVELSWTERLVGDYGQNGEVDVSDITDLGRYWWQTPAYDDPTLHDGVEYWPMGDPDDDGGVEPGELPLPGSDAENWRLARVDGDYNSEINIADITPVALSYHQRLDGYRIYRKIPGAHSFELLANPDDLGAPLTITRSEVFPEGKSEVDPLRPVRYRFTDVLDNAEEMFGENGDPLAGLEYYVAPYDQIDAQEGIASNTVQARVNHPPVAELIADPATGAVPFSVQLDASASSDPDGELVLYFWDFDGDGVWDDGGQQPVAYHTYTQPGQFEACVRVRDRDGAYASTTAMIDANAAPIAVLHADPSVGTAPLEATLNASESSDPDGEIVQYEWDYETDGTYDLTTEVPTANHTYSVLGTHLATVRVTDDKGAQATASADIRVNDSPVAQVNADIGNGHAPGDVDFDASESSDSDGIIVKYEWDFDGDGTFTLDSGTEATVTHHYVMPDTYQPVVRVTDNDGASDTASTEFILTLNLAPIVSFTTDPTEGDGPLTVSFDASASYDNDGTIEEYEWDWDSGGRIDFKSDEPFAEHTFNEYGSHLVTLWVTDDDDLTSAGDVEITLHTGWHFTEVFELDDTQWWWTRSYFIKGPCFPCIAFKTDTLQFIRANDALGETWGTPVVIDEEEWAGYSPYLALIQGKPAVAYIDIAEAQVKFALAADSNGDSWNTPVCVENYAGSGKYVSLTEVDGYPAVAYLDSLGWLKYSRASDANGSSWGAPVQIERGGNTSFGGACPMLVVNGNPAIGYSHDNDKQVKYVRALDTHGDAWGTPLTVGEDVYLPVVTPSLAVVNGNPALTYSTHNEGYHRYYIRSLDANGDSWGTPVEYSAGAGSGTLVVIDGVPVVHSGFSYIAALDADGSAWGDWVTCGNQGSGDRACQVDQVEGHVAVGYGGKYGIFY